MSYQCLRLSVERAAAAVAGHDDAIHSRLLRVNLPAPIDCVTADGDYQQCSAATADDKVRRRSPLCLAVFHVPPIASPLRRGSSVNIEQPSTLSALGATLVDALRAALLWLALWLLVFCVSARPKRGFGRACFLPQTLPNVSLHTLRSTIPPSNALGFETPTS